MGSDVLPQGGSQSFLVQDVFDMGLDEGKRDSFIPSPASEVEGLAALALALDDPMTTQDVANGVEREANALALQMED
jgi:hypothetical protein